MQHLDRVVAVPVLYSYATLGNRGVICKVSMDHRFVRTLFSGLDHATCLFETHWCASNPIAMSRVHAPRILILR